MKFTPSRTNLTRPMQVKGTTTKITVGAGASVDSNLLFDGNAADFRVGLDDGTDSLEIGSGAVHGTTSAIIVNSAGEVTKIGQDTPADTQVLTWDNAAGKVVWAAAAGGAAADDENTILHCEIFAG